MKFRGLALSFLLLPTLALSDTFVGLPTVDSVGGSTAAAIHTGEIAANAATNVSTASTIVKRDASKNFLANAIGLGTNTSPSASLHITEPANIVGLRIDTDNSVDPFEVRNAAGNFTFWYIDGSINTWSYGGFYVDAAVGHTSAAIVGYGFASDYTTGLFQPSHGVLGVASNGTEAMRVTSTQNIAIGTTSAGARLEVNGGVRLNTATAKPTCDATVRGTLWINQGGAGVTDTLFACLKAVANTYSWISVTTGG